MTSVICFTGNAPRHLALVDALAFHFRRVTAVIESSRLYKPHTNRSHDHYWARVREAERAVFCEGDSFYVLGNRAMAPRHGSLDEEGIHYRLLGRGDASVDPELPALVAEADHACVFGASWLQGDLCAALIEKHALNLHVGIAPEYRGSGCNFWAAWDGRPDLVGSTVHYLAEGIDEGDILGTVVAPEEPDVFTRGMLAVRSGIEMLVECLDHPPEESRKQDGTKLIRECKAGDFTEEIAAEALRRWT